MQRQKINQIENRSYLKYADYVQGQEAHLNQYNQMCYPAYAGARADPPSLKKLGRDR
jgi:hypothetical protein